MQTSSNFLPENRFGNLVLSKINLLLINKHVFRPFGKGKNLIYPGPGDIIFILTVLIGKSRKER